MNATVRPSGENAKACAARPRSCAAAAPRVARSFSAAPSLAWTVYARYGLAGAKRYSPTCPRSIGLARSTRQPTARSWPPAAYVRRTASRTAPPRPSQAAGSAGDTSKLATCSAPSTARGAASPASITDSRPPETRPISPCAPTPWNVTPPAASGRVAPSRQRTSAPLAVAWSKSASATSVAPSGLHARPCGSVVTPAAIFAASPPAAGDDPQIAARGLGREELRLHLLARVEERERRSVRRRRDRADRSEEDRAPEPRRLLRLAGRAARERQDEDGGEDAVSHGSISLRARSAYASLRAAFPRRRGADGRIAGDAAAVARASRTGKSA